MLYELFPLTGRDGPERRVGIVDVELTGRSRQSQRDRTSVAVKHGSREVGGDGDLCGRSEGDYSGRSGSQRLNECSNVGRHDPIYSDHANRYLKDISYESDGG